MNQVKQLAVKQGTKQARFRRQFIALALKRARPGSGSSIKFLRKRSWSKDVAILDTILSPGSYVIIGGVATWLYMPERMILDLGILILAQDATSIYNWLKQAGGRQISELSIPGSQWELADGTSLDVLTSDDEWASHSIRTPNYSPDGTPVIALPYLVLMKLKASRAQDLADISRMLGAATENSLQSVRTAIKQYFPEALEDMESLAMLGRLEYEA